MATEGRGNLFGSVLSIVAFIALGVILIWGVLHLFSLIGQWISSSRSGSQTPALSVTAPTSVTSGDSFTLSWTHASGTAATYAIVYQCRTGLSLTINNEVRNEIPCGTAIRVPQGVMEAPLLATLSTGTASTSATLSILLMEGTSSPRVLAQGAATLTVLQKGPAMQGATAGTTAAAGNGDAMITGSARTNSPADFSVEIIAVGMIDPASGAFIPNATPGPNDTAAIQFDIGNVGGSTSGVWSFMATLPTRNGYVYTSPAQAPLSPGSHIVNTLRFTQIASQGGIAMVRMQTTDGNIANDDDSRFVRAAAPAPQYTYPDYQYQQQYYYYSDPYLYDPYQY